MALTIKVNGTALPGEVIELQPSDETLWSDGTGRGADNGLMVGSLVAKKQTWSVKWGIITMAQYNQLRNIPGEFFTLLIQDGSTTIANITCYRSPVKGTCIGKHGGTWYYKDAEVQFIER